MRTVRGTTSTALARVRSSPWLLVVGVVSVLVTIGAMVVANLILGPPGGGLTVGVTVHLFVFGVVTALIRSLVLAVPTSLVFAAVGGTGDRRGLRSAIGEGIGGRAGAVVVSVPAVFAVGGALTAVASVPSLAVYAPLMTTAQAVGYTMGFGVETLFRVGVVGTLVPATLATAVAAGAVGSVAPATAAGDGLATAIRRGLRRLAERPARVTGHGLVVLTFLSSPLLVALGLEIALSLIGFGGSLGALTIVVATVLTAIPAYSVAPVYRAVAVEPVSVRRDVSPAPLSEHRPRITLRRVALLLCVSGVVVGATGAVRVADLGPEPANTPPGYDSATSPDAVVEEGIEALSRQERVVTRTTYRREPASADREVVGKVVSEFDPEDREVFVASYFRDLDPDEGEPSWSLRGSYVSEGTSAIHSRGIEGASRPRIQRLRSSPGWRVFADLRIRYDPEEEGSDAWSYLDTVPPGTFRVVESTSDRVVLRTKDLSAYLRLRDLDPDQVVDGYVRVVVDSNTGYPTEVVLHRVMVDPSAEDSEATRRVRHVVVRIERRPIDVTRPEGAPPKGLVEVVFDALVY